MERKKLATLEVYLAPNQEKPSCMGRKSAREFELEINPLMDEQFLAAMKQSGHVEGKPLQLMQSIIAHELGHFVSFITGDPTHAPEQAQLRAMSDGPNGERRAQVVSVPAEMHAWTLAGDILGDKLNKSLRNAATMTYVMGGRKL